MSQDKLIEGMAAIELLKSIKSTNKADGICNDVLKYFSFIKKGEHLWFANLALSIDCGLYYGFSCNQIIDRMQPKSVAERFGDLVNKKYLFPVQREMTSSHGIKRTFRFFDLEERKSLVIQACNLMEKLKDISNYVCLGYGGVLGATRDGRLIEHDDDLDIVMGFSPELADDRGKAQRLVIELIGDNFKCQAVPYSNSHVQIYLDGWQFDVFIGMISGRFVYFRPVPEEGIPMDDIFPVSTIKLEGVECPVPANPKKYLEWRYGENWMVPDKYFSNY